MDPNTITKKLTQMNMQFETKKAKLNLKGLPLLQLENQLASDKWRLLLDYGFIKKDGWWPET